MQRPLVGVIIGGRSDYNVMRRGLETLRVMGIPYLFEVISPHRNPQRLTDFARNAGEAGIEVLIAAEGGSSLIANHLAAHTTLPIIGVPIDSSPLRGQDSLFSLVMLPPGMPVAAVGINNSENAAILATQILALKHAQFRTVLAHRRMFAAQRTEAIQNELYAEYPDLCDPSRTAPLIADQTNNETEVGEQLESESVTPEPPEVSERIRPGATWVERPMGTRVESLVSTPVPQEPGSSATAANDSSPTIDMLLKSRKAEPLSNPAAFSNAIPTEEINISEPAYSPFIGEDLASEITEEKKPFMESTDEVEVGRSYPKSQHGAPHEDMPELPVEPAREKKKSTPPPKKIPDEDILDDTEESKLDSSLNSSSTPSITKIFKVNREEPDQDLVDHAMMVLLEGGILGLPTDTVYGLAVDATNEDAVRRLYELKGKESNKPLGVLIHHPDMLDNLVTDVPPALEKVIEECWPGALTIILPKNPSTLMNVSKVDRIGVRIPSDKLCLAVIEKVGRPIVVRNASISPSEPINNAELMIEHFDNQIECILDGGECSADAGASTVLSALHDEFEILREGSIKRKKLRDLLGKKLKS